jgi:acyl dehydratase
MTVPYESTTMTLYQVIARNHSHSSENKIHSNDVAQRYGFRGGLVPGVAVFGYMTRPLVTDLGPAWLAHSVANVRFLKPAYEGDRLCIETLAHDDIHAVTCRNDTGELLAELSVAQPTALPPVDSRASLVPATTRPARIEISAKVIDVGNPFAAIAVVPTDEENNTFIERVSDNLAIYRTGLLHPHLLLHWSNLVLVQRFVMPAWIHVSSEIRFRRALKLGDAIEIRALPIEKWERKGHEFVKLYVAYLVHGAPATEVYHTAIYKVAPKVG